MWRIQTVVIILFIILCSAFHAEASWLINAEKFHVSVHGQLSCQDCHAEIAVKENHPDPNNVNKSLNDFFEPDQCTGCHEEVVEEIEGGTHAGEPVTQWQLFENCIECHHPHYQLSTSTDPTNADLNQGPETKCSRCHEFQKTLPETSSEDQACMACHHQPLPDDPKTTDKIITFCFSCHAADSEHAAKQSAPQPLVDAVDYASTPHAGDSCMVCHPRAAAFRHAEQPLSDCGQCHLRHDEKKIRDAHTTVSCGACHLSDVTPLKDFGSGRILWRRDGSTGGISKIHTMPPLEIEASCRRCHFSGNTLGAAAMVLPAKSILCMPCHTATFSVGDTTTILALVLFVLGLLGLGSIWFSGGDSERGTGSKLAGTTTACFKTIFSARIGSIIKALVIDGLLQRRLMRVSRIRWLLHALVFYPFIFRFCWGFIALVLSLWWPEGATTWAMVDKNHPLTAFLFDLSGMLIIIGVIGMIARRLQQRADGSSSGLPPSDWPAYGLLGGIIIVGFVLEGMRMGMTGSPDGAGWAFMGDLFSRFFSGFALADIYGYVWYLHAILTGAFVAYLPFSKMLHMIMAPLVLAVNAATDAHTEN